MTTASTAYGGYTQMGLWLRFRQNRLAVMGTIIVSLLLGVSVATLPFARHWYNVQELSIAVRHRPSVHPVVSIEHYGPDGTHPGGRTAVARAHGVTSLFGHDDLGRSLFYRLWPALLVSLVIGLGSAFVAVSIGTLWGALAALVGGRTDLVMMRIVDVLYGLPYLLTVILLKTGLTRPLTAWFGGNTSYADFTIIFVAIGGVSWLTMARVVRGQVLSLRTRAFVESSRTAGGGSLHILRHHLIPNLIGPIVVYGSLVIPQAVLQEAFLSFLGIGVQQPLPSLGTLAASGVEAVNSFVSFWWLLAYPCVALVVLLLALNLVGDGLRDALDPKSHAARLV